MFLVAECLFNKVPQIQEVDIEMPNIHYFVADLKKLGIPTSGEVCKILYL